MLTEKNPIFLSRARKKFYRQHIPFSLGDLVRAHNGTIGSFQGISTYYNPQTITVFLYGPKEADNKQVNQLPRNFYLGNVRMQVSFRITDIPKIEYAPKKIKS